MLHRQPAVSVVDVVVTSFAHTPLLRDFLLWTRSVSASVSYSILVVINFLKYIEYQCYSSQSSGLTVACENSRLSSGRFRSDPPRETSAFRAEKFHTDDVNLVQNPDELYDWSNKI